jgi:tetratricopeptide (TPR) repeat protein
MRNACLLALLLLPSEAFASWYEARTKHFVVLSDGSKSQAEGFATRLERFDQILRLNTGNETAEHGLPLRVVLRRNAREVQELMWWGGKNVVGFYTTSLRGPVAVVDRSAAQSEYDVSGETVLYHEYAHHFMRQYSPFAYPVWYSEGFAEYHSSALFRGNGDVDLGRPAMSRAPSLGMEKWLPLDKLLKMTLSGEGDREVRMLYAQGWLLTHMLSSDDAGRRQLNAYLSALGKGSPVDDAWQAAFGKTIAESDKDVRAYYERLKSKGFSIRRYYAPKFELSPVAVRELSVAEAASIELDIKLRDDIHPEKRDAVWNEAQALVQRFPQDAYVLTLAAEAALATDRFAEASQLADRAIAVDPNAQRAMVVRGASGIEPMLSAGEVVEAQVADARRWIVRANRLNPEDPMALLYNYLTYTVRQIEPPDNAVDGLRVAHSVLPQSARVTLTLGSALLARNSVAEARRVLSPLAYAPHASGASSAARDMLESASPSQR